VLSSPSITPRIGWDIHLGLSLMAVQQEDSTAATEQYQTLELTRGTALLHISVDRVLGLLANTTGQLGQAVAHFEEARVFCSRAGYQPEYAWTCHDYADALLWRCAPGDREKVVSLLDESLAIANDLGMPPPRVVSLKAQAEVQPARCPKSLGIRNSASPALASCDRW